MDGERATGERASVGTGKGRPWASTAGDKDRGGKGLRIDSQRRSRPQGKCKISTLWPRT